MRVSVNRDLVKPKYSRRLFQCSVWIAAAIVAGTVGYCLLEGWSVSDGFFMTMITFSTVGYGETHSLSPFGKIYTSGLIFISLVLMAIWTAGITTSYISGELSGRFLVARTMKMIQKLSNHSIVFGANIMAESIIHKLQTAGKSWVIVSDQTEQIESIRKKYPDALIVESSPKNELALADANVFTAAEVLCVLESDFDNLLVAMSVKDFNPDLKVITRSDDPRISTRMLKAGVDEVICPFQLSGEHIANLVVDQNSDHDTEVLEPVPQI